MLRRLRDAILLNLAVAHLYHLGVVLMRFLLSYRSPTAAAACCDRLAVLLPERRPFCDQ